MSLDAAARRRYARQLLLGEIGEAGQERLFEAAFRPGAGGDAEASAAATEYLERAGCPVTEEGAELHVPDGAAVARFAGSPALRTAAALVMGAFTATEHLKEVLGIADAREFPPGLRLSQED